MSPHARSLPLPELVPEQEFLTGYITTVFGPVEYRTWKKQIERIDDLLKSSGAEAMFQRLSLAKRFEEEKLAAEKGNRAATTMSVEAQANYQRRCSQALRCVLAQTLLGDDLRAFACRLTESQLLQKFCKLDHLEDLKIPGKSQLQRYGQWLPEEDMRRIVDTLLAAAAAVEDENGEQALGLAAPLDLETYFLDTTCVELNIHFPVDWVLLRDAARTLMKATILVRKRGLKVRMEEPEEFLRRMNQLCIKMTHARGKKEGKRMRKAVLREMKKLSNIIARHAQRHRDLLEQRWVETDLKAGEANQIIARIDGVLERLPVAIKQAHERIIGERKVSNKEKILSLYEEHAAVYVRGKAGANVEFGSQLLLGESISGVIVDWELVCGNPLADTKMLGRSLERMKETIGGPGITAVSGDRGFASAANRKLLKDEGIYDAICPKAPDDLRERLKESKFVELQKRRSQTEARIAIFKNGFLGKPLMSKGHENQKREVAWNVLAHNLWVIARLPRAKTKRLKLAQAS